MPRQVVQHVQDIIQRRIVQAGIDADPEDVVHHEVGIRQVAHTTMWYVAVRGLAEKVAAE